MDRLFAKASYFFVTILWYQVDKERDVVERLGLTMKHAGVAITITSITDFIAFGIGATTQLPALRSFCMYASIGILTIFFFQVRTPNLLNPENLAVT